MKRLLIIMLVSLSCINSAWSADLRQAQANAETALTQRKAQDSESQQRITDQRNDLQQRIQRLRGEINALKLKKKQESVRSKNLDAELQQLTGQRDTLEKQVGRIVAIVRTAAKNLRQLALASPFSAMTPQRIQHLDLLADGTQFPDINDLNSLFRYFNDEITLSGEVGLHLVNVTGRDGTITERQVLTAGPFMSLVLSGQHGEPILYDANTLTFREMPSSPGFMLQWALDRYLEGKSDVLPLDLSAGAALDQLRRTPSLSERILQGGPLVWPIVFIGLLGLIIAVERAWFLKRVHDNTDSTMNKVNALAGEGQWQQCDQMVAKRKTSPVYNVLRTGLAARSEPRDVLESILQEAILKELPRLERFLPFLAMLGAVTPLLGLLGTVTGMIDTFEVIHIAGTGDPRMMSGGISTALITTMLGLAIAIPIMLLHSVLNRQVEHIIGDMEEKAVALTNIIQREDLSLRTPALSAEPAC
ncbi:MotA/TolQ/ExbB proton channel family protein [Ferrimonas sp. SCSIO 43195]|uniref:MotA/TolQ/ExbB proton channel family protein n=1 Tax=Ferrimonas sp. SCSIO 43195 TaxID=2822844 RepID=UPI0020751DD6|nr:DUF3450 family protein [Ferrimonas sp. SCSIO 43195]USD38321.1 DUF3450 family protein [Ferrimonas sp. SCSIO 43195]